LIPANRTRFAIRLSSFFGLAELLFFFADGKTVSLSPNTASLICASVILSSSLLVVRPFNFLMSSIVTLSAALSNLPGEWSEEPALQPSPVVLADFAGGNGIGHIAGTQLKIDTTCFFSHVARPANDLLLPGSRWTTPGSGLFLFA
jgi:hypothetical protein